MDVRNCRDCGKLFNYLSGPPLCPTCMKKLDEKFAIVKEYIYDHPEASIQQVAEDNEVSVMQLKKWVREERLSFTENSIAGLECENCGTMIRTGRFCNMCKDKMVNSLGSAYKEPEVEESKKVNAKDSANARMRFLDQMDKKK